MDFDDAKENIQPLASGRNAEQLETALIAESDQQMQEKLLEQRKEFERAIEMYDGDDPLQPWYEYIEWVEQSYPKSGKETAMDEMLSKCLSIFENDERYKQDRRMLKLYIKYIDSEPNPPQFYELLYNNGIGTMIADLYLCWAHYYDYADNFEKAESVYRKGLDARAQPIELLEQAHRQFGFCMSQRLLYKDESSRRKFLTSMDEQRAALTSLRTHKHRHVGSVRTGSAIRSYNPGRVEQQTQRQSSSSSSNRTVRVFEDENQPLNSQTVATPVHTLPSSSEHPRQMSVVQAILNSTKKNENLREPGPWTQAKVKVSRPLIGANPQKLAFSILEDEELIPLPNEENNYVKGIQLPSNFVACNRPQEDFDLPLHRDEGSTKRTMAGYDKFMLFPSQDKCFSLEELEAYTWFKKNNICNRFTKEQDSVWKCGYDIPIRLPPYFCRQNVKQTDEWKVEPINPLEVVVDGKRKFSYDINLIYSSEEYCAEEILQSKWLNGELLSQRQNEMDLTCSFSRREEIYAKRRSMAIGGRRSIIPMRSPRKSLAYRKSLANPSDVKNVKLSTPETERSSEEDDTIENVTGAIKKVSLSKRKSMHEDTTTSNDVTLVADMRSPPISRRKLEDEVVDEKKVNIAKAEPLKFSIFVDADAKEPAEVTNVFKTPHLPPQSKPRVSLIFPDEDADGCTTQTFNFFIKSQSVSTPKVDKKRPLLSMRCDDVTLDKPKESNAMNNENEYSPTKLSPKEEQNACVKQPLATRFCDSDAGTYAPLDLVRQKLSAIMETTEDANTISSAGTISSKSASAEEFDFSKKSAYRTIDDYRSHTTVDSSTTKISPPLPVSSSSFVTTKSITSRSVNFTIYQEESHLNEQKSCTMNANKTANSTKNFIATPAKEQAEEKQSMEKNETIANAQHIKKVEISPKPAYDQTLPPSGQFHIYEDDSPTSATNKSIIQVPTITDASFTSHEVISQSSSNQTKINNKSIFSVAQEDTVPSICVMNFIEEKTETIPDFVNKNMSINRTLYTQLASNSNYTIPTIPMIDLPEEKTENIPKFSNDVNVATTSGANISRFDGMQRKSSISSAPATNDLTISTTLSADIEDQLYGLIKSPVPEKKSFIHENVSKTAAIDDDLYSLIKSQPAHKSFEFKVPKFVKSYCEPSSEAKTNFFPQSKPERQSMRPSLMPNRPSIFATAANSRAPSMSLLEPMKEIRVTEYQLNSSGDQEIEMQTPFSEENPNTALFSYDMTSIANSTALPPIKSNEKIVPSIENVPKESINIKEEPLSMYETRNDVTVAPTDSFKSLVKEEESTVAHKSQITMHEETMKISPNIPAENKPSLSLLKSVLTPTEKKHTDLDEFYNMAQSPQLVDHATLNNISGIFFDEAELGMLAKIKTETTLPRIHISEPKTIRPSQFFGNNTQKRQSEYQQPVPQFLISEPKTIRPSVFERTDACGMTAMHSLSNETAKEESIDKICEVVDQSVFIVDSTADLTNIIKEEKRNISIQGAKLKNLSATERGQSPFRYGGSARPMESSEKPQDINPFDVQVQNALLDDIDFFGYISLQKNVLMVNRVRAIQVDMELRVGDQDFHILKQIGQGSFGFVYCGRCMATQEMYAFKQERPANLWEFYISLEIASRIGDQNILPAFLSIDYAIIGHNSSVFVSQYCEYGSLANVCDRHRTSTLRNLDEIIVMIFAEQMLSIIDHLHGSNIIHGDIKPNNFLLMQKLSHGNKNPVLKLIDYGRSIDLNFFKEGQTFTTVLDTQNFICTEMMEKRPWTFQLDLFCLASAVYSLLCGKYMKLMKQPESRMRPYVFADGLPVHVDQMLWENVLYPLINVRDCKSLPNLQNLREEIREAMAMRERFLNEKITKFNFALDD